ncbi:TPA: VWA domain-containing protein [Candidatus Poribacteria bacterium]|nr:VWA domain-containing protein [Candidatus Poribacteria bacterium]
MRFENVWLLCLLILIPLLVWLYFKRYRYKSGSILFSDLTLVSQLNKSFWVKYRFVLVILRMLVILLIIIAIARPQTSRGFEEISTEGIDIMLILDASGSMRAEDFKPQNRLQAAKEVVKEFLQGRENDRIGLIVFAGKSYTQCPLTLDYNILEELLDHVEVGIIEDGTAIGLAIANAVDRLKDSKAKSKVAVLLTDGENNRWEIAPITAARAAAAMNIRIYTIGIGSIYGGAPIPVDTVFGKDYIRVDGELVLTKLDEDTLRRIANETSARYFRATDEKKLSQIYEEISKLETTKLNVKRYIRHNELTAYFLLPAAILLLLEIILSNTRFRKIP